MANTFKNAFAANVNHSAYEDLYAAPSGTTTVILGLGQKYILETTDVLRVKSGTATAVDVSLGIMEIT